MGKLNATGRLGLLFGVSALCFAAVRAGGQDRAPDCALVAGVLPAACNQANAGTVVQMPVGENTEMERTGSSPAEGFMISVDGKPVTGDRRVEDLVRRADLALERADLQVTFDGLSIRPRLDLETIGEPRAYEPGDAVRFQSATNYPAFLSRGEVRIIDRAARGGPRTLAVQPMAPNGQTRLILPQGEDLVAVHRVYDAEGRYDETLPLPLSRADNRGLEEGVEDGSDSTTRRRIPVAGGSVTVHGEGVAPGATVFTLGEEVRPAPGGDFVLQRILPVGSHSVDVVVRGAGENLSLTRDVEIPRNEWFAVGVADLTLGWRSGATVSDNSYQRGRLGFYIKGKTATGLNITASADTGEADLEDIFRDLDKKDPRSLILRIDPDDYYPVYGDDSTFEEDAPTSGKFYFRIEKNGNHVMWGNFRNSITGAEYIRNERTLYGLQAHWATPAQTTFGEPKAAVTVYGASPEHLPQRDVFLGTGGSVYFLQRQDLSIGSETLTIEVRDPDTGRIVDRRTLVYGRDYDINYTQGAVTLTRPLSGTTGGGVVSGNALQVNLVAQYEWTPGAANISGLSYGGRVETWVTDQLRLGFTGAVETTGTADQTAVGADLRWQLSDDTYAEVELAHSDGPGFGSSISTNGGLNIDNNPLVAGTGQALRSEGRAGLADLGLAAKGHIGGYYEQRDAGFSSLDYQVANDEALWGVYGEVDATDRLRLSLSYDDLTDTTGRVVRKGGAEADYKVSSRLRYTLGVEHTDKVTTTKTGRRTDVAVRATVTESARLEWYVFGQVTTAHRGLARNDRVGLGGDIELGRGWSIEGEVSDGTSGVGAKALITQQAADNESLYFGYELDPNREFDSIALTGRDKGRFVLGGKRKLSSSVVTWGENTYDLFGNRRSLTSAYGVDYAPDDFLSFSTAIEYGEVSDPINGDYKRTGVSFTTRYDDDEKLSALGRIEVRQDRGQTLGTSRDADTYILKGTARYKIDEAQRLSFNLEAAITENNQTTLRDGKLIDTSVGYALRPVSNDKLNLLFKYRFLYDMYGQEIDGSSTPGPRQKSHVMSVDADYDLNRHWTVGGKLGVRLSDSSPAAAVAFARNDAWLAVVNTRYHLVHEWDVLLEGRVFDAKQAATTEFGLLGAVYKHFGNNVEVGVGYNFGQFSDDLTDLTQDDQGLFVNFITTF